MGAYFSCLKNKNLIFAISYYAVLLSGMYYAKYNQRHK